MGATLVQDTAEILRTLFTRRGLSNFCLQLEATDLARIVDTAAGDSFYEVVADRMLRQNLVNPTLATRLGQMFPDRAASIEKRFQAALQAPSGTTVTRPSYGLQYVSRGVPSSQRVHGSSSRSAGVRSISRGASSTRSK